MVDGKGGKAVWLSLWGDVGGWRRGDTLPITNRGGFDHKSKLHIV